MQKGTAMDSRFAFLRHSHTDIAMLGAEAENTAKLSPRTSILKSVEIGEKIVGQLIRQGAPEEAAQSMQDQIGWLMANGHIDATAAEALHALCAAREKLQSGAELNDPATAEALVNQAAFAANVFYKDVKKEDFRQYSQQSDKREYERVSIGKSVAASAVLTFLIWVWQLLQSAFYFLISPLGIGLVVAAVIVYLLTRLF